MSKWRKEKIGDLTESFAGGTPSRSRPEYYRGNIPWISSGEVNQPKIKDTIEKITDDALENSSAKWIPKNSILVAMYGATAGQVSTNLIEATSNQAVLALVPHKELADGCYLYYSLIHNRHSILFLTQGTGQPNLSKNLIDNFYIDIPFNKTEQQCIAKILTTADAVIEKTQAAITKYKAIKQGMLHDLFTRGIDLNTNKLRPGFKVAPELYKESKLGWIPKDWDVIPLKQLCKDKPTYGINAPAVEFNYQLPTYLRITDIDDEGSFVKTGRKSVNSVFSLNYVLDKGDLVFARTGATVGKTYLYNEGDGILVYAGFLIKVSTNENLLNSKFLKSFTETSYYKNWVELMSQRSAQPGINGNEYGKLLVPTATIEEQEIIAKRIGAIESKLKTEQRFLKKMQEVKKGLMEDLLSGKKPVIVPAELKEFA